jgi:hypothetical protein
MDNIQPTMTIDIFGDKRWRVDGVLHRTDGPAVEYTDGFLAWWVNGRLHRTDGPAVEDSNGEKRWYLYDKSLSFADWLQQTMGLTEEEKVMFKLQYG